MQKNIKKDPNGFPSVLATPSVKGSNAYGIEYGKGIEQQWFLGEEQSEQVYERRRYDYQEYRAYRMGNQNTDRYKKYVNPTGDTSYASLDFSPIAIIPKYVDIVKNDIIKRFFRVAVEAIDPAAASEKDKERNKIAAKMVLKDVMKDFNNQEGMEKLSKQTVPENKEELEFYMSTNFKMAVEIALEQAIEFTFKINRFEEQVFTEVVDDLITLGIGGAKTELHPNKGIVNRYVDPINLLYSYTRSKYFDDIVYAGEVIYMTIAEIRERFNVKDENKLKELAQFATNKWGNKGDLNLNKNYQGAYNRDHFNYGRYPYDNFKVQLIDFEFMSVDEDKYEKKDTRYGNATFTKKPDNYKPPKKSKFKREQYSEYYQCVYGGIKVVGKPMIFDYGKKKNQPRKKNAIQKTELSYKIVSLNLKENFFTGFVQRMIPFADDMMKSWIKMQIVKQKMRPPGLAINVDALDKIDLGDGELSPLDLQDIYDQTGNQYYRSKDYSGDYDPTPPIRELVTNYVGLINEQILAYNHALQQLRDVTGINEFKDGSTPSSETAVGVAQLSTMASNNAFSHIADCAYSVVSRVADDTVTFIQDIIEYSPDLKKVYEEAIGRYDVDAIKMMDRIPAHLFGINVEVDLNDDEKIELMRDIQIALQSGQIDISDKYTIMNMGNMKDAGRYLAMRVKKNVARMQQEKQQSIQMQGQVNQQNEMTKAQAKQAELQTEYTLKSQFEQMMHQFKMEQIMAENQGDANEERIRGEYDLEEQRIKAGVERSNKKFLEDRKDERTRFEKTAQSEIMKEQKSENPQSIDFTDRGGNELNEILNQ